MKNKLLILLVFLLFVSLQNAWSMDILSILTPSGGEKLYQGNTYPITWRNEDSVSYADLYLWNGTNCTWSVIGSNILQLNQSYNWTVPSSTTGNLFLIKIVSKSTGAYSISKGYISIMSSSPRISFDESIKGETNNDLIVSPNPAGNKINLYFSNSDNGDLSIINGSGESVYQTNIDKVQSMEINTQSFIPGVYFLQFKSNNGLLIRKKFIKF